MSVEFSAEHFVDTVCPLDCPDACSLTVGVEAGRITSIDGSQLNPVTKGYICAKVRRFGERVYGPDRLLYPAVRKGPKGLGLFERVSWDTALERIARRLCAPCGRRGRAGDPARRRARRTSAPSRRCSRR